MRFWSSRSRTSLNGMTSKEDFKPSKYGGVGKPRTSGRSASTHHDFTNGAAEETHAWATQVQSQVEVLCSWAQRSRWWDLPHVRPYTPSSEALNMVCQVIANENLLLLFVDVKAAFAQSDKLVRPRGRLFVEPCDGVPLEKNDFIELVQPVYGLDDAPLRWFETVTRFLRSMGLRKSLLDPCVYVQHDEHNELVRRLHRGREEREDSAGGER